MNKPHKNLVNQKSFQERRKETHTRCIAWIPNEDMERIKALAEKNGWIAEVGRNAEKPNIQQSLEEIIRAGLDALEKK